MPASARPHHAPSIRAAYVSLGLGVIGVAWSAIFVRWSGVAGPVSAFYRLMIAAAVLVPWRQYGAGTRSRVDSRARRAAIVAGLLFAADLAFFNTAIMMTSAANAVLLGVNAPIFVALGAWAMFGERPTTRFWLGFALALVGMVAIVGTDVVIHPSLGIGDLFAMAGALCYGLYLLYVQRGRRGMDALSFTTWSSAVGAVCLLPLCWLLHMPLVGFTVRTWAALAGLAIVSQLAGQMLVAHALGRVPATVSSIVLLAQAPITAILAWPLLGESLRPSQVLGGALVLCGIVAVNANASRSGAVEHERPADDAVRVVVD